MNTIEIVRMLSTAPIAIPKTWVAHRNVQWRFAIVEKRDNNMKRREKQINSHHPHVSLLLLDCIQLFFKRWLLTFMQTRRHAKWVQIVRQARSIFEHHRCAQRRNRALSRNSPQPNHATRRQVQCSSWATSCAAVDNRNSDRYLHGDNVRVAHWCLRVIGYRESCVIDRSAAKKSIVFDTHQQLLRSILPFAFLAQFLYCSYETGPPTGISFWGQLYSVFSFCFFFFFSMSLDANEFFPSNETGTRSPTIDLEYLLSTVLKTGFQRETVRSIIHEWNTTTTLSALTEEWSSRHENRPTERNSFLLVLYNISSL